MRIWFEVWGDLYFQIKDLRSLFLWEKKNEWMKKKNDCLNLSSWIKTCLCFLRLKFWGRESLLFSLKMKFVWNVKIVDLEGRKEWNSDRWFYFVLCFIREIIWRHCQESIAIHKWGHCVGLASSIHDTACLPPTLLSSIVLGWMCLWLCYVTLWPAQDIFSLSMKCK